MVISRWVRSSPQWTPFTGTKKEEMLDSFQFFLMWCHLRGKIVRNVALSLGLWHILIFLTSSANKKTEDKEIRAKAISKKKKKKGRILHLETQTLQPEKTEYNPWHHGCFWNIASPFSPGRLGVFESHVLQTTAWPKAVVALAFCSAPYSSGLVHLPLVIFQLGAHDSQLKNID